jgi:hypothetical protein
MGVDWGLLVGALARVEQLTPADSGLLSFGSDPAGGIFVERGRVCWVAARGLQRRLRDLLETHAHLDPRTLASVAERCRAQGLPLGQTLVAEGLLPPNELESALRRHSAESLVVLCRGPHRTSWASHAGRGYLPRFTFCARDLLLDSVALVYPALYPTARRELAAFEGPGRRCVAFVLDDSADFPLPLAESGESGVQLLLALGDSLAAMPRAGHELGATPSFALSTTDSGETILSWWRDELLFVVLCDDRASLAAATAQHLVLT